MEMKWRVLILLLLLVSNVGAQEVVVNQGKEITWKDDRNALGAAVGLRMPIIDLDLGAEMSEFYNYAEGPQASGLFSWGYRLTEEWMVKGSIEILLAGSGIHGTDPTRARVEAEFGDDYFVSDNNYFDVASSPRGNFYQLGIYRFIDLNSGHLEAGIVAGAMEFGSTERTYELKRRNAHDLMTVGYTTGADMAASFSYGADVLYAHDTGSPFEVTAQMSLRGTRTSISLDRYSIVNGEEVSRQRQTLDEQLLFFGLHFGLRYRI